LRVGKLRRLHCRREMMRGEGHRRLSLSSSRIEWGAGEHRCLLREGRSCCRRQGRGGGGRDVVGLSSSSLAASVTFPRRHQRIHTPPTPSTPSPPEEDEVDGGIVIPLRCRRHRHRRHRRCRELSRLTGGGGGWVGGVAVAAVIVPCGRQCEGEKGVGGQRR